MPRRACRLENWPGPTSRGHIRRALLQTFHEARFQRHTKPAGSALPDIITLRRGDGKKNKPEEMIGRTPRNVLWEKPELLKQCMRSLLPSGVGRDQRPIRHRTGVCVKCRVSFSPERWGRGSLHFLMLARMSRSGVIERQLASGAKDGAIGQLAAVWATDFNNILTVIQGTLFDPGQLPAGGPQRNRCRNWQRGCARSARRHLLMLAASR